MSKSKRVLSGQEMAERWYAALPWARERYTMHIQGYFYMENEVVSEPTRLPAVKPQAQHPLAEPIQPGQLIASSFDVSTPQGKSLLSKCYGPAEFTLDNCGEQVLNATHLCVYTGRVPLRDTGEIVDMSCVRLILANGAQLGWCSDIASEQFRRTLLSIVGPPPWNPPLSFRVRRLPSKAHPGGSWYTFELVSQE